MKYIPVQPPEGINVTPEHPLKSFFILTFGTIGLILIIVTILGLAADYLVSFIPVEYEQSLFQQDKMYLMPFTKDKSSDAMLVQNYLEGLVQQLHTAAGSEFTKHKFSIALADTEDANAFAVPGGHIVVTKGLLRSISSENGLSMVLAHEMAHHYERHPLRSTGRGLVVGLFIMALVGADGSALTQQVLGQSASIGSLAFSRKQESSADNIAADLLIKFYGHALGAAEFFQSIQKQEKLLTSVPSYLSTHPSVEHRIKKLIELENLHSGQVTQLPEIVNTYLNTDIE